MVLETVIVISAVIYIFLAMKEVYHQGFKIFISTLVSFEYRFGQTLTFLDLYDV